MLELSLLSITSYIENQLNSRTTSVAESPSTGPLEFGENGEHRKSQPFHTRFVKLDFLRFEGENVL